VRQFILIETGEIRSPQRGEYYIGRNGKPRYAEVNFSTWAMYPILRMETNDQANEETQAALR
jgi:hypothetical protein